MHRGATSIARLTFLVAANVVFPGLAPSAPVCGSCHPNEVRRFLNSAMGASLGPPSNVESGQVLHQRSGSSITIEMAGGRMVHRLRAQGLTAAYEIGYQIGSGKLAHSYIVDVKGYLFESPASWFQPYGWDLSPGYLQAPAIDFEPPNHRDMPVLPRGRGQVFRNGWTPIGLPELVDANDLRALPRRVGRARPGGLRP